MADDRIRELVAAIADGVTATPEQLRGLTPEEIEEVEADQPAPLARTYRQFLELAGRSAGRFLQGSDVFYPSILGVGRAARALLEGDQVDFALTDEDRVILMHQGYQFEFLRGTGPDPEVWTYSEDGPPTVSFPSFTEWLATVVEQQTRSWAQLVPWYESEMAKEPGQPRAFFGRMNSDGSVTEQL